ncbi:hypothetical protein BLNAU_6957 [Blattamonas nauphoetae]|uniref:Uncharacterized protein n=1 Tax=Blattamonas nauphoetae TaxID=2049346 RepID=A0ABQ9Y2Q8_9EUKA|nr:hypothetical protein BLNAU_6957 [Blattamonas nauphoetae]
METTEELERNRQLIQNISRWFSHHQAEHHPTMPSPETVEDSEDSSKREEQIFLVERMRNENRTTYQLTKEQGTDFSSLFPNEWIAFDHGRVSCHSEIFEEVLCEAEDCAFITFPSDETKEQPGVVT